MYILSPCDFCKMYSCPYCFNTLRYTSDFSRQFNNNTNVEDTNIMNFISTLNKRGFIVQEGKLSYIDILKLCSEGEVDSCLGNNVGAPYAACLLPPAPNQEPSEGQEPSVQFNFPILRTHFSLKDMITQDTIMYIKWQERLMKIMWLSSLTAQEIL